MRFKKKYQRGIILLLLLLIMISGISLVKNVPKNDLFDENSISMSDPEDVYEVNNDPTTAYDIRFNEANWLSSISGTGTLWDDDWYQIEINLGEERLKVDLIFNHSLGNIDIEVYDWNYNYVNGNYSMDDNEHLEFDLFPSNVYYLLVLGANAGNSYDLWWEDLMPIDDQFEENDDFWSAAYVDPNWYSNLKMIGYDEDWYRTYLDYGSTIDFSIYFNNFDGNLELELYDPSNSYRSGSYDSDNDEHIYFTADMSGDWRIRVYRVSGSVDEYYDLDIWLSTGDDIFEENDDFYSPAWIDPDYYPNLIMMGSDEDWFGIYLTSGDSINIHIYFDNMFGDLELELYDPSYTHRDGSYDSDSDEDIYFTADISGDWRIRVYRASGSGDMYYDLDIYLDKGWSGDDIFEENDGFGTSAWVDPNWYSDLRIIGDDEDWFHTYLDSGEIIEVTIHFEQEAGNLQLELYDPSHTKRASSYISTQTWEMEKEHVKFRTDISGDWRIRVYQQDGDSDVHYDMDIWILEDWYEDNDDSYEAYHLTDYERKWLSNIGGLAVQEYSDWYEIEVSPGFQHLTVNLKFNKSLGNIYVDIYERWSEWDYGWIGSNYSMTGDNSMDIEYFSINSGVYYILVSGDNIGLEYDLLYDDLRTDFRPDDYYEENDDPTTAYDLSDDEHNELWSINGLGLQYDNDWYRITIDSVRTHLYVLVTYDYQEGPVGIEIYKWDYSKITSNFTMSDNEFISYKLPSNGTYYIRIIGDTSGNVYNLVWSAREPHTEESMIPGYDILIMLSAIFGVATIIIVKSKRSKNNN